MRQVISQILKSLGYEDITVAEDGRVAFRMLRMKEYDFVISDWNMPNMTGIQLLKAIRNNEKVKELPVLLVTAENQKKQVVEAAKYGVNSFIAKPFSAAELAKKIKLIFPNELS